MGNNIDLLTVTTAVTSPDDLRGRKGIVISARVHPGETNSSWMMRGLLNFLTSQSCEAKYLRDNFVIKIVPMINPDGVIIGNVSLFFSPSPAAFLKTFHCFFS